MKKFLEVFLIIISLSVVFFGYVSFIPVLLSIGLILLDSTILSRTKFFSRYVLDITTFGVVLVSIFYGMIIGALFAIIVPSLFYMIAYTLLKSPHDTLLPPVVMSVEKISYVLVAIITVFLQSFIPFVMLVVGMIGLHMTIIAARDLIENKIPNVLAIGVTLVVGFYIAQFLEEYATTILATAV